LDMCGWALGIGMNKRILIFFSRSDAEAQRKSLFFVPLRDSASLREIFVFRFFYWLFYQGSVKGSSLRAGGSSFL